MEGLRIAGKMNMDASLFADFCHGQRLRFRPQLDGFTGFDERSQVDIETFNKSHPLAIG